MYGFSTFPVFEKEKGFLSIKKDQSKILFGAKLNHSKGNPRLEGGIERHARRGLEISSRIEIVSRNFLATYICLQYFCIPVWFTEREREREVLEDLHRPTI